MNVRLIAEGEAEACNDFYNRIYGKKRSLRQWKWDFYSTIYNNPRIPFAVVEDGGKIVGTQAFIPIRMIDEDGVFWTAKSEETLVDHNYRGKKLFEQMYQLLFDYANKNGLAYIWGFTPATRAFKRLGFVIPAVTSQIFYPFSRRSIPPLLERTGKDPGLVKSGLFGIGCNLARMVSSLRFALNNPMRAGFSGLELRTLESAPEDAGHLCERFIRQWGGVTIYRDTAYLRWRIFQNPYLRAVMRAAYDGDQLVGYIAYSLGDDGMGYLVDLMIAVSEDKSYDANDVARLLLSEAVIGTRNMGAHAIRGWRVNDHPFDAVITRVAGSLGFYHIRKGHAVVLYCARDAAKRKASDQFGRWFVSRIYTEGVFG
ncbi:MAG: GNAT family N-acetyltransferase [Candidatus Zixiibacteriota bacterium]|nr:MAG: GNAT family N-acetyltransferase [candidate division Zixibacteria bacterium]